MGRGRDGAGDVKTSEGSDGKRRVRHRRLAFPKLAGAALLALGHAPPASAYEALAQGGNPADLFGHSVAISGDTLVVGAFQDDETSLDSGAVHVYQRGDIGWSLETVLSVSGARLLGFAVAVDGDVIVAGAPADAQFPRSGTTPPEDMPPPGHAFVFERVRDEWSAAIGLHELVPALDDGDAFGANVSASGDTVVVGAPGDDEWGDNSGAVYVFTRGRAGWTFTEKLTADDAVSGDHFGTSVAVSGTNVLIGANGDDERGNVAGAAYVFSFATPRWTQVAKLTAGDGIGGELFGTRVDIEGTTAIVGAPFDGVVGLLSGSAYVFEPVAGVWTEVAHLVPGDAAAFDRFGLGVAAGDGVVAVGAPMTATTGAGTVYLFRRETGTWLESNQFESPNAAVGDSFGYNVALSASTVVAGAHREDAFATLSGNAYVFGHCGGYAETVAGTAGDDVVQGTDADDVIVGLAGDDLIIGHGGDDRICGGDGADSIEAGDGNDWVFGGAGDDILSGGVGDDVLRGGAGDDELVGGAGRDELYGEAGSDRLYAEGGDDFLVADGGPDTLSGGPGTDLLTCANDSTHFLADVSRSVELDPSCSFVTVGGSTGSPQLDEARAEGFSEGYSVGYDEGYTAGHEDGHTAGYAEGHADGYDAGYDDGHADGVDQGYDDGELVCTMSWTSELGELLGQPVAGLEDAVAALTAIVSAETLIKLGEGAAQVPECYWGGNAIWTGRDIDRNGELDVDEVEASLIECVVHPDVTWEVVIRDLVELAAARPYEWINHLRVHDVPHIDGLSVVEAGEITIHDVADISGLANLRVVGDLTFLSTNLTEPHGPDLLTRAFRLRFWSNPLLTTIDGFASLTAVGSLELWQNPALTELPGLSSIVEVETLDVDNNPLTDLDDLALTDLGSGLVIRRNEHLTSVDALHSLTRVGSPSGPPVTIQITDNPNLSVCQVQGLIHHLQSLAPSLDVNRSGNLPCEAPSVCVYSGPGTWQGGSCSEPTPPL